ncbi:MAG: DUF1018 domain-containing protein, partial [Rhodobacteraceae bacterium]|nr:DUF1018 domain-containing protein [Paracoccaceae bacterium]
HVSCRQLGLDGDARRALQLVETGKASMKEMDGADLLKVIKRLKKDGFKTSSKGTTKRYRNLYCKEPQNPVQRRRTGGL